MASRKSIIFPLKCGTKKVRFKVPMTPEEERPYVRDYTAYIPPEDLSDETLSSEEEAVVPEENITTGRQLLATVKNRIKEEKPFNSKRADEHRAPFRFSPKIGTINENKVFRVSTDDRRYGVFRSGSEEEISDSGSDWSEGPDTYIQCNCCSGIKYLCCCHCLRRSAGKVPPVIKWVKDVNTGGNTDGNTGGNTDCDTGGNTDGNTGCNTGGNTDGENVNVEEKKPKRVGKMKRLRNFLRRLCCCVGCDAYGLFPEHLLAKTNI